MRAAAGNLLAHGLEGSTDLPVPLGFALVGASWALAASFAVLGLAWRTSRLRPDSPGVPLPRWLTHVVDARATRIVLQGCVLAFAGWVGVLAFAGPGGSDNPLPGVVYVYVWVGLVPVALLCGQVWAVVSPLRTLHRIACALTGRPAGRAVLTYPVRLGYWPAAAGLFAFVWLELASPDPGSLPAVRTWCVAYTIVMLAGAALYGERWFERADPFDVYSAFVARLSPFGRDADRRIVLRNPLANLAGLPADAGVVAVVATLLGSTAFDSFSASSYWLQQVRSWTAGSTLGDVAVDTAGLLVLVGLVGVTFRLAARATGGLAASDRAAMPGRLAHSLVPIVVGYVFAHYLTYLVEKGQATAILLLGLDGRDVAYVLSAHPGLLATLKVGFVVLGHVLAVIAAHDAAVRLLPARHRLTGQLAMLLTMVTYTFGGLLLLFSV